MVARSGIEKLEDIPNIGAAIASALNTIDVETPADLVGKDPYRLYDKLCELKGERVDPCVIDIFISAVRYMGGEPSRRWWYYTAERKRVLEGERGRS